MIFFQSFNIVFLGVIVEKLLQTPSRISVFSKYCHRWPLIFDRILIKYIELYKLYGYLTGR
jgi:hypothetical protein